jgi:hypothetical protein
MRGGPSYKNDNNNNNNNLEDEYNHPNLDKLASSIMKIEDSTNSNTNTNTKITINTNNNINKKNDKTYGKFLFKSQHGVCDTKLWINAVRKHLNAIQLAVC